MDDGNTIKFAAIGLLLASLVMGYIVFSTRFTQTAVRPTPSPLPSPAVLPSPIPSPQTLGQSTNAIQILQATRSGQQRSSPPAVKTLPKTGFPTAVMIIFSTSAIIAGFFLRKFPE